jgi:Na+/proline symporter
VNLIVACILAYIASQLALAFFVSRRPKTESDYLLAGRSLGPWLGTFTVFATWFGAEVCIGAAGEAYTHGISGVITDPFGYALGMVLMGLFFAAALWKRGLVTLADLFQRRYGVGVERLAALIMIPTSVLWAAAQIRAFGQVLASASELGIFAAITMAAVVVILYTAVGGMWADAVTDLVQGIVLILGIFALGIVFAMSGGLEKVAELPPERFRFVGERTWLQTLEIFMVPVLSTMAAQEMASRALAMRGATLARNATIGAGFLYLAVGLVPVGLGLVAAVYIGPDADPEQVLSRLAQSLLNQPLYILFLGALVSAILSTLSGALLVAGSLAAHNIVLPLQPKLGEKHRLRVNRIFVVVFGVIAYAIALSSESAYELVQESSSLGSAGILVLIVFALWGGKFGGKWSAYGALVAALAVYVFGSRTEALEYPYLTSLGAAVGAYLLLSFLNTSRSSRTAPSAPG